MNDNYTVNYSLKEMVAEFRTDTKDALTRIESQTTKTNGRVASLERSRSQFWGALGVIIILGSTIITLAIIATENKIDTKINDDYAKNKEEIAGEVVFQLEQKYDLQIK